MDIPEDEESYHDIQQLLQNHQVDLKLGSGYDIPGIRRLLQERDDILRRFELRYWYEEVSPIQEALKHASELWCAHTTEFGADIPQESKLVAEISQVINSPGGDAYWALQTQVTVLKTAAETAGLQRASLLASLLSVQLLQWSSSQDDLTSNIAQLIRHSLISELHKAIVLSLRGRAAEIVLSFLHEVSKLVGGMSWAVRSRRKQIIAEGDRGTDSFEWSSHHSTLRRLLLRLSKEAAIMPSALFLHGVECTGTDAIPVGEGHFSEVFRGSYNGKPVALKRLRVYQLARNGEENTKAGLPNDSMVYFPLIFSTGVLQRSSRLVPIATSLYTAAFGRRPGNIRTSTLYGISLFGIRESSPVCGIPC